MQADEDTSSEAPSSGPTHIHGARIYTVGELTEYIKGLLDSDENLNDVWVRGEISSLKQHSSGHMYFSLKDERSQLSCAMFRRYGENLRFTLEHGLKVIARGTVTVYEPRGIYELIVREVLPDGIGALHMAFMQLKKRLENEGLFADEHKRPIPKYPEKIGVVTSPTGAAIRDIINVIRRRYPVDILVAPALVQGDGALDSIVRAIQLMNLIPDVDVMIVGRGGGSLEDLWAFNEEIVARAIYDSKIPVISAVGHETDFTIADFVADMRAPTPSAAAEMAVPDKEELAIQIRSFETRLVQRIHRTVELHRDRLQRIMESPVFKRPLDRINQHKQHLDDITLQLNLNTSNNLKLHKKSLEALVGKLDALNPHAVLSRGYSITMKLPEEEMVKRIAEVERGDRVKVVIRDGEMRCQVEETKEVKKDD